MCKKNELTLYILSISNFIPVDICEMNFIIVLFSMEIKSYFMLIRRMRAI